MQPTRKQPLFLISGASGVGKSTACELLFQEEERYIVLESDLLWRDYYNTPEDNYDEYRQLWMTVAANVAQIGMPIVLCGCTTPEQFEEKPQRALFSETYYVTIVCEEDSLLDKMKNGRGIEDVGHLQSSVDFNRWLTLHAAETNPPMHLIDNTHLTPRQVADQIHRFILEKIED